MKYKFFTSLLFLQLLASCSNIEDIIHVKVNEINRPVTSGEVLLLNYENYEMFENVEVSLIDNKENIYDNYGIQKSNGTFKINRFLNSKILLNNNIYFLKIDFSNDTIIETHRLELQIQPSIVVKSFCATENCESLTGNIIESIPNRIYVETIGIKPNKYTYYISTLDDVIEVVHDYTSIIDNDWLSNIIMSRIPDSMSSYISLIRIVAEDDEGNFAETALPFRVVRPMEVKHFGKYELAETYEPVPATGCIPGSIGNNVRYTESQSETRQNSVSITLNNSWTNSNSSSTNLSQSEGISIGETENTIRSSSLSGSETFGETETNSASQTEQSNINFSSNDGESWNWNIAESETQGSNSTATEGNNTGASGSVTTGVTGEGSLPFLAKVSGRVDVTAGVTAGWTNSNSQGTNEANSSSRGYSTGGTSQSGRSYGTATNDSRSHSLTGTYVLSSSTSSTITEASGTSSGRVWNMSESIGSGRVVTEGNSESLSKTIIDSSTSSTTFSYSAYIPRGRYGIFYRQTSRYVKLSEIITYDLNGFPSHSGYISMNSWAWAPELSISNSCNDMLTPNLPEAACHIPPCGE